MVAVLVVVATAEEASTHQVAPAAMVVEVSVVGN